MKNDKKNLVPLSKDEAPRYNFDVSDEKFLSILESDEQHELVGIIAKKLTYSQELMLCQKANKQLLKLYISEFKLNLESQIALIDRDFRDLLKLHYLKYGIDRKAMAYYCHRKEFKAYIGIK